MRREVDFIIQYQQNLKADAEEERPLTAKEQEYFELLKTYVKIKESQFVKVKNTEKEDRLLNTFYPMLCDIAEIQGGRVILDIHEENYIGELVYIGENLVMDDINELGLCDFSALVEAADEVSMSAKGSFFQIKFVFILFGQVQVEDHTGELMELEKKLKKCNIFA